MTSIGTKIRNARKEAGMTQVELAKKTSLSRSYIGDIEKDRYNPSVATLRAIAEATGVPVESILGNSTSTQPPAHPVVQGDPVSELFDNPEIRSLARRNFADMSPEEAKAKQKDVMRVVRALFDDKD
ncbi:helix-turn-helix transcriptional regulator [Mitsuokella jalaludinii]|uniref:helix-turn-helix transcriptional regulator n=1 Tax=Mitsuokella jalaludinii TaxID=187979 RepID=UPI00259A8DF1|nr:helix-turn-helix transcriptional regulator [uncultured Mitsuokella sp.]